MFKKPLGNLKTSAPLRGSDRRKLKQRIVLQYALQPEEGDVLMPEGVLSVKFSTHLEEPGYEVQIAYLDADGNALWFTVGKGSQDLVPTIHTLWKKEDLLPFLSTPAAVIPILIGGADLMIPGVIHHPPSLDEHRLVAIRRYFKKDEGPALSPPLAIGRMALPSDQIKIVGKKGKAVLIVHTWKDHLWEMGSKADMPEDTILQTPPVEEEDDDQASAEEEAQSPAPTDEGPTTHPPEVAESITLNPEEVTELLNKALLQAVSESLTSAPLSAYPMPATIFYTNHILPSRPAFPTTIITPACLAKLSSYSMGFDSTHPPPIETDITIKSSSHKSLTTFLKAAEKSGLITLKPPQKQQPDVLITSVNPSHPNVKSHKPFVTVKSVELKETKKAARTERLERKNQARSAEVQIRELWKPFQSTLGLFDAAGERKTDLYTPPQVNQIVNDYIKVHNLMNRNDQACVNLNDVLGTVVKGKERGKAEAATAQTPLRVIRRDELLKTVLERMQNWYEIRAEGHDVSVKKGRLSPIHIVVKMRQGRKACTLTTNFEPFLVINAQEMADELRKICAGATSIGPVQGKPPGSSLEVLVQGKQSSAVVEYLQSRGIPKKWIEVSDLSVKK